MKSPSTLKSALQAYARRVRSGAGRAELRAVEDAIIHAVSDAEAEAYMTGRVYAKRGEKEEPHQIGAKLAANIERVTRAALATSWPRPKRRSALRQAKP